jgi:hypothetical protein
MAKNIGTLISSAIRPNDSLDPIASAFGNEIKGGLHCYQTIAQRNAIITARMELGMLVSVTDENKIYKLTSIIPVTWVEYGTGTGSSSEWQNSVKTINSTNEPNSPISGDRYLIGSISWWTTNVNNIVEFDGYNWNFLSPTNGMSVRVDDENGITYKYNGTSWIKERNSQVYSIDAAGDGVNYTSTISDFLYTSYEKDVIFLSKFSVNSTDSATININGLGVKNIIKPTVYGLTSSITNDILAGTIYRLTYDGMSFQLARPYSDEFNNKYKIEIGEYVVVPPNTQYWLYGDIDIEGTLINYGRVVIANGNIVSGNIENLGDGSIDLITTGGSGTWYSVGIQGPTGPSGGTSGSSGVSGSSGTSGFSGTSGSSGFSGSSGTSGSSGISGSSGVPGSSGVSGTNYTSKTKIEIGALISSNGLIPGTLYKISGVHPTLYDDGATSGTTIYLTALTTNTLSKEGHGEFWNPKYNKNVVGQGVWSNVSSWTATLTSGYFIANETILGNFGQTGYLFGGLESLLFVATSIGWGTATSIRGTISGAYANVTSINLKSYNINDKVIWGGYSWRNVAGYVGDKVDILMMNNEWSKYVYSSDNYHKVIDIIEYDYDNDWISRRYEVLGNNDIIQTFIDSNLYGRGGSSGIGEPSIYLWDYSSISVFMFGNTYDVASRKGFSGVKVIDSYFESVDSYNCGFINLMVKDGGYISGNRFYSSNIGHLTLTSKSYIASNTLINSVFYSNTLSNYSSIEFNILDNSIISYSTLLSHSDIFSNYCRHGKINHNNLNNYSRIVNNIIYNSGDMSFNDLSSSSIGYNISYNYATNISGNKISKSDITSNILSGFASIINYNYINSVSTISNNTLSNSSGIIFNSLSSSSKININSLEEDITISHCNLHSGSFTLGMVNTLTANITLLTMENSLITGSIAGSTILTSNFHKIAYKRPDGVTKLRYYNNSDIMVISNITD